MNYVKKKLIYQLECKVLVSKLECLSQKETLGNYVRQLKIDQLYD